MKKCGLVVAICLFSLVASAGEFKHSSTASPASATAYEMYNMAAEGDSVDHDPWTLYLGVGLGAFGLKVDSVTGLSQSNFVAGGLFQVGLHVNKHLSAELRFGAAGQGKSSYSTIKSGATTVTGVPLSVSHKIDSFITYLVKPTLPISEDLDGYLALGGTTAQITVTDSFGSVISKSQSGFSFGGGMNWYLSDSLRLETEAISYWSGIHFDSTIKSSMWGFTSVINMAF